MRTIRFWTGLKGDDRGASVAIGNFDGVHIGHQHVIGLARDAAADTGAPLGVISFEPHPREFFAPDAPAFRLMNAETRANRLAKLGVERLYELPFAAPLARLSPENFVREVLVEGLAIRHAVIGADFHFGKARAGDADSLVALGKALGFGVTIAGLIGGPDGQISSTAIRKALSEGRTADAARMLGHWHRIDGEVLGGDRRGRELGYPTANMSINRLHQPKFGIYAVRVEVMTGPHRGSYGGAASIGTRPMFGENQPNLETFIFDFAGDLYGEHLSVALVEYLRPEARFDSLPALVAQMDADCLRAREILARD